MHLLSKSAIFESLGGGLDIPSKLKRIPMTLCDDDGQPLIQSRVTRAKYLSPGYSVEKDRAELLRLGVRELTSAEFVMDAKDFIDTAPGQFHDMPQKWHSSFSKALFRLINDNPVLKEQICELRIVPLKDGRWISPSGEKMCFSDSGASVDIPKGISMVEIDPTATSDLARRSLLILLGAQTFSNDMVCDFIISTHASPSFRPNQLSRQDLISHAAFLWQAGWKNLTNSYLWLSTEMGSAQRSCETYIDSDSAYSAALSFRKNRELPIPPSILLQGRLR